MLWCNRILGFPNQFKQLLQKSITVRQCAQSWRENLVLVWLSERLMFIFTNLPLITHLNIDPYTKTSQYSNECSSRFSDIYSYKWYHLLRWGEILKKSWIWAQYLCSYTWINFWCTIELYNSVLIRCLNIGIFFLCKVLGMFKVHKNKINIIYHNETWHKSRKRIANI